MSMLIPLFKTSTGLREQDLRTIIASAPNRYKTYEIPKRSGGFRLISQPAREVKALQRIIATEILQNLPIHPAATAYREGVSIRDNALKHVSNGPILKLDFRDFFPSIRSRDWEKYCVESQIFSEAEDISVSTNILFFRERFKPALKLAIGAPSSPLLSNVLMYEFDEKITSALSGSRVVYTRYADDLVFSAPRTGYLQSVLKLVTRTLKQIAFPSLAINPQKTVLATKKYKRMVTGLILANDNTISIGHQRKQWLRVAMHHASIGRMDTNELAQLSGWLAFVKDVEPTFYQRLCSKHDKELLKRIKSSPRM